MYRQVHATEKGPSDVRGVVLLDGRLYVARKNSASVAVHDPGTMKVLSSLQAPGLDSACNMAACSSEKCLYITASKKKELHKVQVADGSSIHWTVSSEPDGVSVAASTNVFVTLRSAGKLQEFTAQGTQLREISLPKDVTNPRHAVLLSAGQLLLCHGWGDGPYSVRLLNADTGKVPS